MRRITVTTDKAFTGMIRKFEIYMDGKPAELVGNGETVQFQADENAHTLYVVFPISVFKKVRTRTLAIPAGDKDYAFRTYLKNAVLSYSILIEPVK